jgi:hypothetical protein
MSLASPGAAFLELARFCGPRAALGQPKKLRFAYAPVILRSIEKEAPAGAPLLVASNTW